MHSPNQNSNTAFEQQCCKTTCADESLWLHAERVIYWPAQQTLLVADVHLGKEHVFGRAGNAIPAGPSDADIVRLSALIDSSSASRLLVLGDLIHAKPNSDEAWLRGLSKFLDQHQQLSVEVVAGNHDKLAGQALIDSRIVWHSKAIQEAAFVFQHEPGEDDRGHVVCGHIHPCYRLIAGRNDTVRAPVFWFGKRCSVLPSFGQFTGGYTVTPEKADRLFMVGPDCVLPVFGDNNSGCKTAKQQQQCIKAQTTDQA